MTTTENFELKTSIHTNSQQTFDKNAILTKNSIDTVYEKEFNVVENDKNSIKKITQKQINEELHRHGHKKSLLIAGKMRLTEQGRTELKSHYEKYFLLIN